jgi:hypothetical protein
MERHVNVVAQSAYSLLYHLLLLFSSYPVEGLGSWLVSVLMNSGFVLNNAKLPVVPTWQIHDI